MTATAESDTGPHVDAAPVYHGPSPIRRAIVGSLALVGAFHLVQTGLDTGLPKVHEVVFVQPLEDAKACLEGPQDDETMSMACSDDIDKALETTGFKPAVGHPKYIVDKDDNIVDQGPKAQGVNRAALRQKINDTLPVIRSGVEEFTQNGQIAAWSLIGLITIGVAMARRRWL